MLAALGFENVQTYIASGNVVLKASETTADALSEEVEGAIQSGYGFKPAVVALSVEEFAGLAQANPYRAAEDQSKWLHLYVLCVPPAANAIAALQHLADNNELVAVTQRCLYLFAPEGIGRSKLAAGMEKTLGLSTRSLLKHLV